MKKRAVWLMTLALWALAPIARAGALKVNVAYMPNYASLFSVVTGIEMGYFAKEGLEVNLVEFADGPTIIAAMENGSIDMGYIGPGAHKLCIQGYAQIFCMSHLGNADAVLGIPSRGVKTVADLKGKRVGYASGTSSETILNLALQEAGLAFSEIIPIEMDASALVTATLSGAIDACAAWSPATATIQAGMGGDVVVLANNETFADRSAAVASWIVGESYLKANPQVVEAFTRGLYRALDYHSRHMEEVCRWVAQELAVDEETVRAQRSDGHWLTHEALVALAQNGAMKRYYQVQQESFLAAGAVDESVPVESYVRFDNMLAAAASLRAAGQAETP